MIFVDAKLVILYLLDEFDDEDIKNSANYVDLLRNFFVEIVYKEKLTLTFFVLLFRFSF